ncbi:acyltransferase family protein [Pedobacter aquatilis]|uniref:acyltransferase family protein n=1 Tax=Pedobacter aquatilis TaxID=351343 RepID=UPI003977E2BE
MITRTKINDIRAQLNAPFSIPDFLDKPYYPSLNGWRAIAVIIVICEHLKNNIGHSSVYSKIANIFIFGRLGVDIFFVLSGFLITSILIKEKIRTGKINISKFFIRRSLRIFPVLYLYLVCCMLLNYFFQLNIAYLSFIWPLLYVSNIIYTDPWLAHTWSLSIEEQFYLIWPLVLRASKRPILLYLILITLLPALKILIYLNPSAFDIYINHIYIPTTALLTGAVASIILFKKISFNGFLKESLFILSMLLTLFIFYLQSNGLFGILILPFGTVITNLSIAYCIIYSLKSEKEVFIKFLNHPIIVKIGIMSYSIYIWQQLFLQTSESYRNGQSFIFFPVNLIYIVCISYLSYNYYERYFLILKNKYTY